MVKLYTLVFIYNDKQILLGMKKRGLGADRWNGFGGKVHAGESIVEAAARELHEEVGVTALDIKHRGINTFNLAKFPEPLEVHIFSASKINGTPTESEEMRPQWFDLDKVPYEIMWVDDKFWLPQVLAGKNVKGAFAFGDEQTILHHRVEFS